MVINYDRNPDLSTDRKLDSLAESVQLAIDELKTELAELRKKLEERSEG